MLAGPFQLRVLPTPEFCHRTWNDFSNAIDESHFRSTVLKCTLLCNWCLGPFNTGTHHSKLVDSARHLMSVCGQDYLEEIAEQVALDRGETQHDLSRDEWIAACSKRLTKATRPSQPVIFPFSDLLLKKVLQTNV